MFRDRVEAGRLLAGALTDYPHDQTMVMALAGGGVPVACIIARELGVPLDVIVAEPVLPPRDRDYAVGWVTARGARRLNPEHLRHFMLPPGYLAAESEAARERAATREAFLRPAAVEVGNRRVVLVTDGIEDETAVVAAILDLRTRVNPPAWIAVAAPAVWPGPRSRLPNLLDELILLETPMSVATVGLEYRDYAPLPDADQRAMLAGEAIEV